ncbi:hypothetical protein K402DRAFT_459509 [Aulographum hederae CBS 113979]|uniref:CAP-Gly domain-containing protein n=1 Tax=Aulographum hederae CBS 113979 TaxID=1176131 RepID=A0A6G1HES1_9PEZI|nr:hypothetical protein K402DRAFT_459509 [Aulographum hederae CBS 113979]
MDYKDFKVGQLIELNDGKQGYVRFVGETAFAADKWIGVEFEAPEGKNDGPETNTEDKCQWQGSSAEEQAFESAANCNSSETVHQWFLHYKTDINGTPVHKRKFYGSEKSIHGTSLGLFKLRGTTTNNGSW